MLERLQKIIAHAGVASRREAETMIREGRVTVNGRVIGTNVVYGEALGVSQSLSAGARVLGPAGGGFIFSRFEASAAYLAAAVCAAGALGLSLLRVRAGGRAAAEVVRVRTSG